MAWRLPARAFREGKGPANRRALKKIIASGARPGIVARLGREPIGWCALAPRETYDALARSRVLKPVDERPVWSISCLFVMKPWRRRGLSVALLRAAVEFAARRGAGVVEGYPVEPTMEKTPDPFVWTGTPSAFRAAGFREVLRRSRTRPIMRFEVSPNRTA
jgi:GNAT superfamily N-acetyltransferase